MSTIAWYKKRMEDLTIPSADYMKYWNIVRDLEFNAARTYNEGIARCEAMLKAQAAG